MLQILGAPACGDVALVPFTTRGLAFDAHLARQRSTSIAYCSPCLLFALGNSLYMHTHSEHCAQKLQACAKVVSYVIGMKQHADAILTCAGMYLLFLSASEVMSHSS